ncbi:MAG TPA: hypothetical protein VMX94_03155 [Armatimonadota bacterium]|nr:hypothetical protein [Armatimonadota bacterium]
MRMRKQTVMKDDGRLITYYWFDRKKGSRGQGIQESRATRNRFPTVASWKP